MSPSTRQALTHVHDSNPSHSPRSRSLASSAAGSDGSTAGSDDATSDPAPTTTPPASPASPKAKSASGTPFGKKASAPTAAGAAAVAKKKPQPAKLPRSKNLLIVGLGNPGKEYTMTRHNAGFLVIDELAKRLGADLKLRSAFQGEYGSTTYQGKSIGLLKPTTFMNNSGQSLRKVCGVGSGCDLFEKRIENLNEGERNLIIILLFFISFLASHQVLDYFKLTISSVLVVVDEVALDMGQIRLRQTGSAGGHNGLKSIEGYLKSKDYNRLRIGVGGGEFSSGKGGNMTMGAGGESGRRLPAFSRLTFLFFQKHTAAPGQMVDHVLDDFTRSERKQLDDLLMDAVEAIEDWIEDDNTDKVMTRVNAPR